ncbi:trehalase-like [Ursus americanus]|uniref:trehalase-like n=1 Tax=Ursus americanus TaxID=9643 RepID=UPI001E67C483|nr:trehalase-like [Ursus americanus]
MEGLLLSEMPGTVKGMLQNFLDLVRIYGHVPKGARVYYLQRSQPPLLTLMVDRYLTHTNDTAFLRDNIGTLALELDFWTENRTISVSSGGKELRPESLCCPLWGTQAAYQPQEGCRGNLPQRIGDTVAASLLSWAIPGAAEAPEDEDSRQNPPRTAGWGL